MPARQTLTFLTLAACSAVAADRVAKTWNFDNDPPGAIAGGFRGEVGDWKVVATPEGNVLAQTGKSPDAVFNVALVPAIKVRDLDLSVRLKQVAGDDDRGGGLVWRAKDAKNYYIARFNHLEDNYRLYKVVDGTRTMFKNADVKHDDAWHTLRVIMNGSHIECFYDDKKMLEYDDATFADGGMIGVWSKADARSYFDDLTLKGE